MTTVGVLLIDSLDDPHRSIAGDYDQLFSELLAVDGVEVELFDGWGELPAHDRCDGWVIPGSRHSVYDDLDWVRRLETWTLTALDRRTPLAGVCFGHQLVARVLGAPVGPSADGWNVGAIEYEVCAQPSWTGEMPDRFRLLASHRDQVAELPAGATLLASSDRCPIAGYTLDDAVICVQAHPEFVAPLAASLYRSRVDTIGQESVELALGTLDRPLDRSLVAGWLLDTIRHAALG